MAAILTKFKPNREPMKHTIREIYADGEQFSSKIELWQAITASAGGITPA